MPYFTKLQVTINKVLIVTLSFMKWATGESSLVIVKGYFKSDAHSLFVCFESVSYIIKKYWTH